MHRQQRNINRLAGQLLVADAEIGERNWDNKHRGHDSSGKGWYKRRWHRAHRRQARFEIEEQRR